MKRAIVVACIVLPIAIRALAYIVWERAYRTPPPRDLVAEFAAIEGTQGIHEPGAWRVLTDLDARFEETVARWGDANAVTFVREHDPMLGPPPDPKGYTPSMFHNTREDMADALEVMQAELDPDDPLHGEALQSFLADNTLARLYADSDLHEELDTVFALPGLVPPPLGEMVTRYGTGARSRQVTRSIEHAETARLRLSLEAGNSASAIDAMRNLDTIARIRTRTPGVESYMLSVSGWTSIVEALTQHLRRGVPELALVEAARPLMLRIHTDMRTLALRAVRADRLLAHASVAVAYEGDESFGQPDTFRIFWLSPEEMATTVDRVYDAYERYFEEGPGNAREPAIFEELWDRGGDARLYAPVEHPHQSACSDSTSGTSQTGASSAGSRCNWRSKPTAHNSACSPIHSMRSSTRA